MAEQREAAGDIGRRIALRRAELGLTCEQTAARAGTAPEYLRYVEEQAAASPGPVFLLRLADALDTTVSRLRGGDIDLPPGIGEAAQHPDLVALDPAECRSLLAAHGIGRLAVSTPEGPVIIPVNYTVVEGAVVYRTAPSTTPAPAPGANVAFEVDHIDEALSQGWSVLVNGLAEHVTDPDTVKHLVATAHSTPWAGGDRDLWVRIAPQRMAGRRIRAN